MNEINSDPVASSDVDFDIRPEENESSILGVQISSIRMPKSDVAKFPSKEVFDSLVRKSGAELIIVRVPANFTSQKSFLQRSGFKFIDRTLDPVIQLKHRSNLDPELHIQMCTLEELDAVKAIARKSFQHTRYHLDANIKKSAADARMAEWVESSFYSPSQKICLVKNLENRIVAFIIVDSAREESHWLLTSISEDFAGTGAGTASWNAMLNFELGRGTKLVSTRISSANIPALNLYRKLNFSLTNPQDIFHYHVQASGNFA